MTDRWKDPVVLEDPNGSHTHALSEQDGHDMVLHRHEFDDIDHTHTFDGEPTGSGQWLMQWGPSPEDENDES